MDTQTLNDPVRAADSGNGKLAKGKLGTFDIVFFVMSAAAPLTVAVSSAPLSFLVGGVGAPGAMLMSGIVLILFAIGFTAMSRFVRNTGAFYAYAAEIAILLVVVIAILAQNGPNVVDATVASFDPRNVFFATGASALFVFGFGAFLGFEGTVIYAEEAKNPQRTVPRATYIAIAFLAIFYALTFWALTVAFGVDGIIALANSDNFEEMMFIAGENTLGAWAGVLLEILIVTSFFACTLAFHNACSRYLFSLGRERLLPKVLARTHPRMQSPHIASLTLTVICLVSMLIAIITGSDPFMGIGLWSYAIGVAGLIFSQGVAAVSVIGFFWKDRRGYGIWRVIVAPVAGATGLIAAFIVIVTNFDLVSGVEGPINALLLVCVPIVFGSGIVLGIVMKRRNPDRYAALTQSVSVVSLEEAIEAEEAEAR